MQVCRGTQVHGQVGKSAQVCKGVQVRKCLRKCVSTQELAQMSLNSLLAQVEIF